MGRDPPVDPDCDRRDRGGVAVRIAVAWLLARKDFWGKSLLDGLVHLPLGCRRWSPAICC
jgi:hypothetical protein